MPEKVSLEGLLSIDFNEINKDPHSHIELKPINQQRPLYVLLDDVTLCRHVVIVHLHTNLESRFT